MLRRMDAANDRSGERSRPHGRTPEWRAMTTAEQAAFASQLADLPDAAGMRWRFGLVLLVAWTVCSGLAIGLGLALVTGARALGLLDWNWRSPSGAWIAFATALAVGLALAPTLLRQLRAWRRHGDALRQDLAGGRVYDEHLRFVEAAAFVEPEHGGTMWLLRSPDERAFLMYDDTSLDPADAPRHEEQLRPAARLHLVRAPGSKLAIVRRFAGDPLPGGPPVALRGDIEKLPEGDDWVDGGWHAALARLRGGSA